AAPVAAGERHDRLLVLGPAREQEASQEVLGIGTLQTCCPLHALQHRAARVELHLLLGEVRRDDAVPEPHRPTLRLALLQDRLEQRRLARAVRPDERDVLATLDREGRAVEQDAVADRNPQIFGLQDGAPAARWLEELEPELPRP